jgi:hypothetical protein
MASFAYGGFGIKLSDDSGAAKSLFFNRGVLVNPPITELPAGVTVLSEVGAISAS